MNTNQNLLDLVKVIDNSGNSIITDSKQFSWKSASNGDILTINNISLQPSNRYVVQLSENLLDKDGSKLSGNRVFSFSTRGAVYLQMEL